LQPGAEISALREDGLACIGLVGLMRKMLQELGKRMVQGDLTEADEIFGY
jgi:hypothetical protein